MTWWSYGKGVHRRDAIRTLGAAGAGSFAPAGGQVSQRPDQGSNPPQSAVAPSQAAGTLRARIVIVFGTTAGVYLYNPSYASGNLSGSFTEASASPLGEQVIPGAVAFYNNASGQATGLQATGLAGFKGSFAGGWTVASNLQMGINRIDVTAGSGTITIMGPSGDLTGATDSAEFATMGTGQTWVLMPGTYRINTPLVVPDQASIVSWNSSWGIPSGNYGNGSLSLQGSIIQVGTGFSGAQIIGFNPTGDAASQHGGQRLTGITVSGAGLPAANTVNGIESVGFVGGVRLTDVVVWGDYNAGLTTGLGGHGLYCHNDGTGGHNPDFWQVRGCKFSACGGYGMETIAMSDSWYVDGECTGNNLGGANIQNGGESRILGWRFNNNATSGTTPGLAWSGLTGFTGKFVVDGGCDFSSNGVGLAVSGGGTGTIALHSPVADGNTTQYTYAGSNHVTSDAAYNTSTAAPTFT